MHNASNPLSTNTVPFGQPMHRLFCCHVPQHPSGSLQPQHGASHYILPSIPSTSAWSETPAFAACTCNPSCHATRVLQTLPSPNQTTLMNASIRNEWLHLEPSSLITTSHISSLAGSVLCFSHPVQLTRWFHSCQSWEPMPSIRHTPWALSLRTPLIAAILALTDRYVPALQTPQLHRYNFLGEKPVLDT